MGNQLLGRLYDQFTALLAWHNLPRRGVKSCWSVNAYCLIFRSTIGSHRSYLLVLYRIRPNLQLATYHNHIPIPPLSRKKTQHPPQSYRLLRLRSRPTPRRHHHLHPPLLPPPHRRCILPNLRLRPNDHHNPEGRAGNNVSLPQSFPSLRPHVTTKGFQTIAWRNSVRAHRHCKSNATFFQAPQAHRWPRSPTACRDLVYPSEFGPSAVYRNVSPILSTWTEDTETLRFTKGHSMPLDRSTCEPPFLVLLSGHALTMCKFRSHQSTARTFIQCSIACCPRKGPA
jgi:hypothetical protein